MSNDFWNQQHFNGQKPLENNGASRSGSLLRDYRQQMQQGQEFQQYSPLSPPPIQGRPPVSPLPTPAQMYNNGQQQGWPGPQNWPSANNNKQQGQGWVANTMQKVRRWSGRVAAVPPVDQNPLVLYHPGRPLEQQPPKSKPWKRSRSVRVAMMMRHRRERWRQSRPKTSAIASSVLIAFLLLIVISASSGSAYAYKYYQDQLPRLQGLASQQISQTSRIYDRNGVLLYEAYDNRHIGGGRRTPVSYNYLPQVLKDAQTSAEDPTFWTNSGIDPQAILRAGGQYLQAGGVVSGASTITQQVIKNLTNDTAQTINRKISEAALAIGLTQQYPKQKILEMYFNISPYGAQNLGVEAAVEDYFHLNPQCDKNFNCTPGVNYLNCESTNVQQCHPEQCDQAKYCDPMLGLARASLLAGLPQSPVTYDPTFGLKDPATGQKYYLERQQYVLDQMLRWNVNIPGLGPITQDMVSQTEAMTAKMKFPVYTHPYYHGCQHFVNWVIGQLTAQLGDAFFTGGFNIYTSIDYKLEAYVEQSVRHHLRDPGFHWFLPNQLPLNTGYNINNSAAVVMNAKTGEVLAMDGSSDYNSTNPKIKGNFNSAVDAYRQPGSSFKPIVYATAFQQGWYPGIVIPDTKTYFPEGTSGIPALCYPNPGGTLYCPQDYGGHYNNVIFPIRKDLANSFNVPAVKTLQFAGLDNVVNMARRFGITAIDQDMANYNAIWHTNQSLAQHYGLASALGTIEVPLIQMVGAYQVLADQGKRVPPHSVLDIWDNYGHHLYHYDPTHPHAIQVLSPQITYILTSVLSDEPSRAFEFLNDHELSMWDWQGVDGQAHDVAAKTGTTENFKDNWTIGYTPDVVVGVWSGNADGSVFNQGVVGITGAAPIWHDVIEHVSGRCDSSFNPPCFNYHFTDRTFIQPPGVVNACVSSANGLAGSGNCDWMLDGEQPKSSGMTNPTNNPTPTPTS
jgi:membrane peptidoglycan carboxypeptidase